MFDTEFFPTPKHIAAQMIRPLLDKIKRGATILEPSAGKGDLLEYVKSNFIVGGNYYSLPPMYAIEQSPDLRYILQEKGFKVIDNDFLNYSGTYIFDIILMNPPFSNGDEHLLKAWDLLDSGHIVCLLNSETINNPFSAKRQLLRQIIIENGTIEPLGKCFIDAERKTNVDVTLIRLEKKSNKERFDFFDGLHKAAGNTKIDEEILNNQIARNNIFENLVTAYNQAKEVYRDFIKIERRLEYWQDQLFTQEEKEKLKRALTPEQLERRTFEKNLSLSAKYNKFTEELNGQAWNYVINKTNIQRLMTSKVKEDFKKFSQTQGIMDFTVKNISEFFDMLLMNRGQIMEQCLVTVFDELTKYDEKNKIHTEGWKTNSHYKVNQKVICPHFIDFNEQYYKKWGERFHLKYNHRGDILTDIDKAMCYLTGKQYESILSISDALKKRFDEIGSIKPGHSDYSNTVDSHFFTIQFWKKGTMHITFKDKQLWQEFNIRVAKNKNWLPGA